MAVTQPVATERRVLHVWRPGRVARRFVIGSLFGVLVVLAALLGFTQSYAGRVLPGIVVGGVDVSGMTEHEARGALDAALASLEDGQIELVSSRTTAVIPYADVGRVIDDEGMLAGALAHGRDGTRFEEAIAGIRGLLQPTSMPVVIDYDRDRLDAGLAEFRDLGHRPPVDASVAFKRPAFMAMPAAEGVSVDTTRIASLIDQALIDPSTPSVIRLTADSIAIAPAISDADAARAIATAERIAAPIKVTAGKKTWPLTQARIASWMSFVGTGAAYGPVIDHADVPTFLKAIKKAVLTKPRDAQYLRTRSGAIFGVAASSAGRALDADATTASIMATLDARADGPVPAKSIKVTMMAVAPELTTGEATRRAPLVERIGSWTTYYQSGPGNGFSANITVPARRLDGVVIKPGQTFDFWNALGEISFRTGYRMGNAIIGGHTAEGRALAGGICSASTTLFNAAARGGLQITARQPHWYYITRYPLGLDATVSDSQTMRFRNDTAHSVMIKSFASPGVIRFDIWSVPNGRTVTWSKPSVSNVVRGYDTVRYTSALAPGQKKRIEYPVDGKHVVVTRTVRDARGRVINRDTFVSNYHRMVGVTLIGR